ncbi:hypothetical protein [Pseudanabaena sp. Chao 1811]|uniref:hypothetical protein n=1 Tax=Pseudanabaena sp. Chao 1811 TaxID=2963092 RepID=UPI0022F3F28B|nr:hypothetical protein [Pseudanabaena sp. Chao 1811]
MQYIRNRLEEGKELISTATPQLITPQHIAWIDSFISLIQTLDPLGDGVNDDGLAKSWWEAKWHDGGDPFDKKGIAWVFAKKLAVINSLLLGQISVADHLAIHDIGVNPIFGRPQSSEEMPEVFVVMPFSNDLLPIYEDHIRPTVLNTNLTVKRGDDFFAAEAIISQVWSAIYNASIVIAECTRRNANVFYEIGIAHTLGKPTILISQFLRLSSKMCKV